MVAADADDVVVDGSVATAEASHGHPQLVGGVRPPVDTKLFESMLLTWGSWSE